MTTEIEITIILITIAFINKWREVGAYKKMRSCIKMATKGKNDYNFHNTYKQQRHGQMSKIDLDEQ